MITSIPVGIARCSDRGLFEGAVARLMDFGVAAEEARAAILDLCRAVRRSRMLKGGRPKPVHPKRLGQSRRARRRARRASPREAFLSGEMKERTHARP